jgi:type I restriction enzyme M protein
MKLQKVAGHSFYNTSNFNFEKLLGDQDNLAANLLNYVDGFSPNARDIMYKFDIKKHIKKLAEKDLLYVVFKEFCNPEKIDLHPGRVSNIEMGYIFEELIRRFSEQSNETAGEHFTPREVIKLMVNLLFVEDRDVLQKEGLVRTLYDPACGTGGMLSVAEEYLQRLNPNVQLSLYGQELNDEAFAICKSDMLIKGHNPENIAQGNTFSKDYFPDRTFDYMLCNPPFGVDWRNVRDSVEREHKELGFSGRFGAGTPRINDGSLLFLQHMLSKMKDEQQGTRLAIVFNGSPLFTGGAGSSESEIRKWIIENDWLEAIIALPEQLFYNTGIFTYVWVLTNRKSDERKGKVQLINAIDYYEKMKKSLGNKRNYLTDDQILEVTTIYHKFEESNESKIFDNEDFGYHEITVDQPMRLNFRFSEERIKRLWDETIFTKLVEQKKSEKAKDEGRKKQEMILKALHEIGEKHPDVLKDRESVIHLIEKKFNEIHLDVKDSIVKTIWKAIAEHDETAPIIKKPNGKPLADKDVRDNESVTFKEDIKEYFEREVKPYVEDAWINKDRTRIGYEIPLTRYFYEFEELRSLKEINNEIKEKEREILNLLEQI